VATFSRIFNISPQTVLRSARAMNLEQISRWLKAFLFIVVAVGFIQAILRWCSGMGPHGAPIALAS